MKNPRTIEDRLREQYSKLLPEARRVAEFLEAEIKYHLLPISRHLDEYERVLVTTRVKECESAIDSLRRRQATGTFDTERAPAYTLTGLPDLAGVRVLVFPSRRLSEINRQLRKRFRSWKADPVLGRPESGQVLAFKYSGYTEASKQVRGEVQIASILIGLFWEVEHDAIYKPGPRLKGIEESLEMKLRTYDVYDALKAFEQEFESLIQPRTSLGKK